MLYYISDPSVEDKSATASSPSLQDLQPECESLRLDSLDPDGTNPPRDSN